MKIIHILPHNIEDFTSGDYRSFDHHSVRFIQKVKRFWASSHPHDSLEQELWMLTKKNTTNISVIHDHGFHVRLFPVSIKLPLPLEISFPMMRALIKNRSESAQYHLHSYYLFMNDILSVLLRLFKKQYVIHFRGGGPSWTLKSSAYTIYHYLIGLRISLVMAKAVVVQNRDEEWRVKKILWVSPRKILYFPNTVPAEVIVTAPEEHSSVTIVLAGRLDEKLRSAEDLLTIFKTVLTKNPSSKILFIGKKSEKISGPLEKEFSGRISVANWMLKDALLAAFQKADIYLHTNTKPEGSPAALIEAQSQGATTIAFDVEGVRDIIHNGANGMLATTYDEFGEYLLRIVEDKNILTSLRQGAIANTREYFTDEAYFPRLIEIYSQRAAQS